MGNVKDMNIMTSAMIDLCLNLGASKSHNLSIRAIEEAGSIHL